jgi:hypothetical protein
VAYTSSKAKLSLILLEPASAIVDHHILSETLLVIVSNREIQNYNTALISDSQEAPIIRLNGHSSRGASPEMH